MRQSGRTHTQRENVRDGRRATQNVLRSKVTSVEATFLVVLTSNVITNYVGVDPHETGDVCLKSVVCCNGYDHVPNV